MINIPKTIKAGHTGSSKSGIIEAHFLSDTATKTQIQKHKKMDEFENIPYPGFTLLKTSRHTYAGESYWKLFDPRGYEVSISSTNLEKILHTSGITEGLIQEKCVWARRDKGTTVFLMTVNDPEYLQTVENTTLLENKVSLRDVSIGDKVLCQNGNIGIYYGSLTLYGPAKWVSKVSFTPEVHANRRVMKLGTGRYFFGGDLKILKVLEKASAPMTKEEVVNAINTELKLGSALFTQYALPISPTYHAKIGYVSASKMDISLSFDEIDINQADVLLRKTKSEYKNDYLMLSQAGRSYIIYQDYAQKHLAGQDFAVHPISIKNDLIIVERAVDGRQLLTSFDKFYTITKHVGNDTYL